MESLKKYQDKYTRVHYKPTKDGKPSSNNGWASTALAKRLGYDISYPELQDCYELCKTEDIPLKVNRSPKQLTPPISKDEILALVSLGLLDPRKLERSDWNFCNFPSYLPEPLSFRIVWKAIKVLYRARKEHRNYLWEEYKEESFALMFYLMPWDQYYVKKYYLQDVTLLQTIFFYINLVFVLIFGSKSIKLVTWVQLEDIQHPAAKLINYKKCLEHDYGREHPFRKELE